MEAREQFTGLGSLLLPGRLPGFVASSLTQQATSLVSDTGAGIDPGSRDDVIYRGFRYYDETLETG